MSDLRGKLIRLAKEHPEFRKDILPLLKTASPAPEVLGGNWKEKQNPHRWVWTGSEGPSFTVTEKIGPAGPIYKMMMLLPDGNTFETQGQKTAPEMWFKRAAQLYADWQSVGAFDLSQTPERWSKKANFPAQDIGKTVSGPTGVPGSDAQKPWSKGEFTQQEFEELDERQESGDMSGGKPNLDPMKVAQAAYRKARLAGKSQEEAKAIAKKAGSAKKADFEWFRGMVNQLNAADKTLKRVIFQLRSNPSAKEAFGIGVDLDLLLEYVKAAKDAFRPEEF